MGSREGALDGEWVILRLGEALGKANGWLVGVSLSLMVGRIDGPKLGCSFCTSVGPSLTTLASELGRGDDAIIVGMVVC